MSKEIDQRQKHEIMFRCNCGYSHFVSFCYDKDILSEFWVELIDEPTSLWGRIKNGLKYIFKGGKLYWSDIGLTSKDLKKLRKFIDNYLTN